MKLTRVHTFTASLLVLAMGAQILAACGGDPPEVKPQIEAGPGDKPGPTQTPIEAGPDGDIKVTPVEAGTDADADVDADTGTTTPVQNVEGLTSIAIAQSVTKAAVGTLVQLTINGTFTGKNGDKKTIELKDYNQLDITVGADLVALPTRDFGGLALLAQKPGKTTFKVTEKKTGLSADGALEVSDATLASLALTAQAPKLAKGLFQNITATATFSDKSTQDVTLLTDFAATPEGALEAKTGATNKGIFTTLKEGTATVSATYGDQKAEVSFEVLAAEVASLAFVKPAAAIALRTLTSLKAEATLTDGSKADVTEQSQWKSSNTGVLLVDETGLVTAAGLGTADITVTTANDKSATTTLTVTEAVLERLFVVANDATGAPIDVLVAGKTRRLALKGELSDQSIVDFSEKAEWTSKDASIVSIDNASTKGLLTAKKAGETTLVVKYGDKPALELAVKVVDAAK